MLVPYYKKENFVLFQGDSLELLRNLSSSFDMIFADPPYFLSTGNGMININPNRSLENDKKLFSNDRH